MFLSKAHAAGLMPIQGTDIARNWDFLYYFLNGISLVFFVLIVGLMVLFAIKYRKKAGQKPKYIEGHRNLEIFWTLFPTILLLFIFAWGWAVYVQMRVAPSDAMDIRVVGRQWLWQFQYDDGRMTTNELFVPVHQPIKLTMTSDDVLHSFFIPNFRIKRDVVPGTFSTLWFEATVVGEHVIYCAEYCGGPHSGMLARLYVLEQEDWEAWQRGREVELPGRPDMNRLGVARGEELRNAQRTDRSAPQGEQESARPNLIEQGERLFSQQGCIACHSVDGTPRIGPTMAGLYGSDRKMIDGSVVEADEQYIKESIEEPNAKIVEGYQAGMMPPYKGVVSATQLNALIAFIKSL
jgi:cytochrome c oxidase subunit II